jgi:hypothetical protein
MSYFYDRFTHDQPDTDFSIQLSGPKEGVSNACTRGLAATNGPFSIEDRKLKLSVFYIFTKSFFLVYEFSPYPTFPPMTISTTVTPNTGNTYFLEYTTTSNKTGKVNGKIVGNSLSFELDEPQSFKSFGFFVFNGNGVSSFTLGPLIGGPTRIPVPIKQVRKPRRRHEIIGVSKISFPLAQHQSE